MNLDMVSCIIRFDKISNKEGEQVWNETYLKDFVFYGSGGANDAQKAKDKANELNRQHKSPDRYFMAVREDVSKALKLGLFDKEDV
ncbi:hypothetical protein [Vibrio phage vB_VibM_10AMN]|uniref:Uncharacterized protein n=1 Tax=Staphylococcus phage vB_VibM_10AMN12 TaxID=3076785 RepID=A0AA96KTA8_9CAUD|nr:hypothetical protein [Vibrio phage vB_VibM_10AMN]WNO47415.1 hypothetical protein [Staphylococcus phage vB_VibM_10AMN12]